ncbi:MAG: tRNA (adenosine(37)-N6)-threonylcarbamoyltransferase complex ATPase subunit type 1 TsaE [Paracoccaceae bacterium]
MTERAGTVHEPDTLRRDVTTRSVQETVSIGRLLADTLAAGDVLLLRGQLGAGKSVLCRAAIQALLRNPSLEVASPSYTVVNVYAAPKFDVWHVDLYRLGAPDEIIELGIEDAGANAVMLVEWGNRWPDPPARRLEIEIGVVSADVRHIKVDAHGDGWQKVVTALERVA